MNSVLKRVLEHAKVLNRINELTGCVDSMHVWQYKSCHVKEPSPSKAASTCRTKGDKTFQAGAGDLDVSEGWLELIMICQCCGTLQEGEYFEKMYHLFLLILLILW